MKVVIVCLYPREAAPIMTIGLARGLVECGIEVFAILSEEITNRSDWTLMLDRKHLYFCRGGIDKKHPFNSIRTLLNIYKKFNGIVFKYCFFTFPSNKDYYISKTMRVKEKCMFLHDAIPHSSTSVQHTKKKKKVLQKADIIVVMTKSYIQLVKEEYRMQRDDILYMRIPMLTYPKTVDIVHRYDVGLPVHFLFFGRIDGYKGLDYLADACRRLRVTNTDFIVTIAGNGDFSNYKSDYKGLNYINIENRYIDDNEIESFFNIENTVVVLPYIDATQSGVIPMAFYYHTPVILTDVGGLKEQMFDGAVGLFCAAKDVQSLADAMKNIVENPSIYNREVEKMDSLSFGLTWNGAAKRLVGQLIMRDRANKKKG